LFLDVVDLNDSRLALPHGNENKDKKRKNVEDEVIFRKQKVTSNNNNNDENHNKISAATGTTSLSTLKDDKKTNKDKDEQRNSLKHISVNSLANLFKSKFENNSNIRTKSSQLSGSTMTLSNSNSILLNSQNTLSTSNQNLTQNSNGITIVGSGQNSTFCHVCGDKVYIMERLNIMGLFMHPLCFRCDYCSRALRHNVSYSYLKDPITNKREFKIKITQTISLIIDFSFSFIKDTFYCSNHVGMANTKQQQGTISRKKNSFNHHEDLLVKVTIFLLI
jgi:hypothetical protein